MATIVTRSGKGSALTFAEVDANFTNLNTFIAGAQYRTSAFRNINNSVPIIVFETQTFDGGGATPWYNSATGVFTVPTAGLWLIGAKIQTAAFTLSTAQNIALYVYKNGSWEADLDLKRGDGVVGGFYSVSGQIPLRLAALDQITIRAASTVASTTNGLVQQNYVHFTRLGV